MSRQTIKHKNLKNGKKHSIDIKENIKDYKRIDKIKEHTIQRSPNYIIRFLNKSGRYEVNLYVSDKFSNGEINNKKLTINQDIENLPDYIQNRFNECINKIKMHYNLSEINKSHRSKKYNNGIVQYTKILQ